MDGFCWCESESKLELILEDPTDFPVMEEELDRMGGNSVRNLNIEFRLGDLRQPELNSQVLSFLQTIFHLERQVKRISIGYGDEPRVVLPLRVLYILLMRNEFLESISLSGVSFAYSNVENCQSSMEALQALGKGQCLIHCEILDSGLVLSDQPNAFPEAGAPVDIAGLAAPFLSVFPSIHHATLWGEDENVKVPSVNQWKHILKTDLRFLTINFPGAPDTFLEALSSSEGKLTDLYMTFESLELSHFEELGRYLKDDPTIIGLKFCAKYLPSSTEETRKLAAVLAEALKANAWKTCPLQILHIHSHSPLYYGPQGSPEYTPQYEEETLKILAQGLMHQTKLQDFFLPRHCLTDSDAAKNIRMYLELNQNSRHAHLNEHDSYSWKWYNTLVHYCEESDDTVQSILDESDSPQASAFRVPWIMQDNMYNDADHLFCILRANPALWLAHVA